MMVEEERREREGVDVRKLVSGKFADGCVSLPACSWVRFLTGNTFTVSGEPARSSSELPS